MSKSEIYSMKQLSEYDFQNIDCFIFALHDDDRSVASLKNISAHFDVSKIIAVNYGFGSIEELTKLISAEKIIEIIANDSPIAFTQQFYNVINNFIDQSIVIDFSCFRVPEMFYMMKILSMNNHKSTIRCIYSIPYDYEYLAGDFGYKASIGDLENYDLFGFGGNYSSESEDSTYVVFLGFEGALSLKVLDDAEYRHLNFVNGLPSFYQKYKDISIINNSSSIRGKNYNSMLYISADNPFETYNMLESLFSECSSLCISPLGTKATSLGICLYALTYPNTRIVFPISNNYSAHVSNSVVKTWVYDVALPSNLN